MRRRQTIPEGTDLVATAGRVLYVGSVEHKTAPSFAGPPKFRSDASPCPPHMHDQQQQLTEQLAGAIRRGHVGAPWEGEFPCYVWAYIDDICYEGRLVNQVQGQYKG